MNDCLYILFPRRLYPGPKKSMAYDRRLMIALLKSGRHVIMRDRKGICYAYSNLVTLDYLKSLKRRGWKRIKKAGGNKEFHGMWTILRNEEPKPVKTKPWKAEVTSDELSKPFEVDCLTSYDKHQLQNYAAGMQFLDDDFKNAIAAAKKETRQDGQTRHVRLVLVLKGVTIFGKR